MHAVYGVMCTQPKLRETGNREYTYVNIFRLIPAVSCIESICRENREEVEYDTCTYICVHYTWHFHIAAGRVGLSPAIKIIM